jgi:hypothetical protein
MTTGSKDVLAALTSRLREEPEGPRITFEAAANEIADKLKIKYQAATMTLYGLCATGNVRWVDASGETVEEHELTVASFSDKPTLVDADDVRHHLAQWSTLIRSHRGCRE